MKKIKYILLFFLLLSVNINAQELYKGSFIGGLYNTKLSENDFILSYDADKNYLSFVEVISGDSISIAYSDINKFRAILQKYVEWELIAVKNNATINKEIVGSPISVMYYSRLVLIKRSVAFINTNLIANIITRQIEWEQISNTSCFYLNIGLKYFLELNVQNYSQYYLTKNEVNRILEAITDEKISNLIRKSLEDKKNEKIINDLFK